MNQNSNRIARAFCNDQSLKSGNAHVEADEHSTRLYYRHNMIAEKVNGKVYIGTAGWPTQTTLRYLRAIPHYLSGVHMSLNIAKGNLYLNGEEWDGVMREITNFSVDQEA